MYSVEFYCTPIALLRGYGYLLVVARPNSLFFVFEFLFRSRSLTRHPASILFMFYELIDHYYGIFDYFCFCFPFVCLLVSPSLSRPLLPLTFLMTIWSDIFALIKIFHKSCSWLFLLVLCSFFLRGAREINKNRKRNFCAPLMSRA
jgi:hypothetical protein